MTEVNGGDPDVKPEEIFKFRVLTDFKGLLTREVTEAVKIQRAQDRHTFLTPGGEEVQVISMNRKYEHFAPQQLKQKNSK